MSSRTPAHPVLHIIAMPESRAEEVYIPRSAQVRAANVQTAAPAVTAAIASHPEYDVVYKGGRTLPNLTFTSFYLGGDSSWNATDRANIDRAIAAAMSDRRLNNVMQQYFTQLISSTFRSSSTLTDARHKLRLGTLQSSKRARI